MFTGDLIYTLLLKWKYENPRKGRTHTARAKQTNKQTFRWENTFYRLDDCSNANRIESKSAQNKYNYAFIMPIFKLFNLKSDCGEEKDTNACESMRIYHQNAQIRTKSIEEIVKYSQTDQTQHLLVLSIYAVADHVPLSAYTMLCKKPPKILNRCVGIEVISDFP